MAGAGPASRDRPAEHGSIFFVLCCRVGIRNPVKPRLFRVLFPFAALAVAACVPEPPPRTTADFLDDPIALEATLARCNADRTRTLRDPECRNAREAAQRISVAEEEERLRKLEAQSQRKLEELRALQQAADEARRRAKEAERRAEEAELLRQLVEGGVEGGAGAPGGETAAGEPAGTAAETPGTDPGAGNDQSGDG